jgi:hypothetical protein
VSLGPLTRLRLAFVGLGVVLLAPLGFLLRAVDERVEAQRRLRHEVVAERIFDELERELTALLAAESARPSTAYDEPTRVEAWAPFVVGYFKASPQGVTLLAADQLEEPRAARLREALGASDEGRYHPRPTEQEGVVGVPLNLEPDFVPDATQLGLGDPKSRAGEPTRKKAFPPRSSPDVLQKLNRSQEERVRKGPSPAGSRQKRGEDPMQRY